MPANYVFVAFQLTFAVITAALISGAIADRVKFSAWLVFLPLWVTLSYFPLAHMVWGGGFLSGVEDGLAALIFGVADGVADVAPIDYAGGTVVHINAGVAGLVLALLIGKRLGFGKEPMQPHNLTLTMIGAGLLWFGWFGFNVGSIVFPPTRRRDDSPSSPPRPAWSGSTPRSPPAPRCSAGCSSRGSATARPPRWVPPPASSPVWSRSPRPAARCRPLGSIALGVIAGALCAWPSA